MAEISKQALLVANNTDFPNNNAGAITPAILRSFNTDMIDSTVNQTQYNTNSGSWNVSIGALNTFTASQQPQFTNLNAFTASQLTINSGYNTATQSLSASIAPLQPQITSLQNFTASINQIADDGIVQGTSTRLYFYGLVSASIVQNVGGPIASINILQDSTKAGTGSVNEFTSSLNQLNSFSASALNSISLINQSTASLNLATASLYAFTASTNNTINGYSSSFYNLNTFTASAQISINNLNAYTASTNAILGGFATTGSNSFNGNQVITGSLLISSSAATDLIVTGAMGITGTMTSSGSNGQAVLANIALTITSNQQSSSATYGRNIMRQSSGSNAIAMAANPNQGSWVVGVTDPSIITYSGSFASGTYYAPIRFQSGDQYTDGRTTFTTPIVVSGSATITGSVLGNVVPLTIASNTASMDLSKGNFFTLSLVSGSATQLTATNIKAGQTINLLITQSTPLSGSLTYNSTFKFPAGNNYIQTAASGAKDIITFVTFDDSVIYAAAINNLI